MVFIHLIPTGAGIFLSFKNLNTFTFALLFDAPFAGFKNYDSILFDAGNPLRSGFTNAAWCRSSKPTTLTSRGTLRCMRRSMCIAPSAILSLPAMIAVTAIATILVLVAGAAGAVAFTQYGAAREERELTASRQVAAQASLLPGQSLRPVVQARIHQRPSAAVHDESPGTDDSNLRPRSAEEGSVLVAKD